MRVLHLEDDPSDSLFIERAMQRQSVDAAFIRARTSSEFQEALKTGGFDVVVVDNGLPGFGAREAIAQAKSLHPTVPVIVCSGAAQEVDVAASFAAGAHDYVLKDYAWQLAAALRRLVAAPVTAAAPQPTAMALLMDVVQKLSLARDLNAIIEIVRRAARELTQADGATFALREGACCYYVDEDAIGPLWKGQRFPLEACISGWAMLNRKSTVIPDIYQDARIAHDAYRPTFVHSMAMVPVRTAAPIGAIGSYWAEHHECTPEELMLLEALANMTSVALENVDIYQNLEQQVNERTRELYAANQELEAFASAVSHDLRARLRAMDLELETAPESPGGLPTASVGKLKDSIQRMRRFIEDLLRLSRISRVELQVEPVNLEPIVRGVLNRLTALEPQRRLELKIDLPNEVQADPGLIHIVLEKLLSNAWRYSTKREVCRIEFTSSVDSSGRRVFCISDNRAGFDSKLVDRLFKPVARAPEGRDFSSAGIGLATAQRIIHRHGGEIWARSAGAHGVQFLFTLSPR